MLEPPPIPSDRRILFFKRDRAAFGWLSNYFEAPIELDGVTWRSSEFYYQAQKSHDPAYRAAVQAAKNSDHAKGLGGDPRRSLKARKRSWFRDRIEAFRPDWHEVKAGIMETAVRAKFTQNADLRALLLATEDAELIEDSAHDPLWGLGRDGHGGNAMGLLLMRIREEIRGADSAGGSTGSSLAS